MPKIHLIEVSQMSAEVSRHTLATHSALQRVQGEIQDLCRLSGIQGATAVSIRNYFSEVHLPIVKALIDASETLDQAFKKMLHQFKSEVDDSPDAIIRSEHLTELQRDLGRLRGHFETIHQQLTADVRSVSDVASFNVPSATGLASDVQHQEHVLSQLNTDFTKFAAMNDAGELSPLLAALEQSMQRIKTDYSPHFGSTNFYTAGSFAKTEAGKRLKTQLDRFEAKEDRMAYQKALENEKRSSPKLGYVSLALKTVPPILYRVKGIKIEKEGDYFIIKGRREMVEQWLDRQGKTLDEDAYKLGARRIRVNGINGLDKGARKLIKEAPSIKDYLDNHNGLVGKGKVFTRGMVGGIKGWKPYIAKSEWAKLGQFGKMGKVLGVAGTLLTVGNDFTSNIKNGHLNETKFATDTTVDIGSSMAAAGVGALAGSFFLPPIGTAVGAVVGFAASYVLNNWKLIKGKSIVEYAKKATYGLAKEAVSWL